MIFSAGVGTVVSVPSFVKSIKGFIGGTRARHSWLDHVVRAFKRYQSDGGERLAASVTFFGFLAFFPLIALAFSVLGYVLAHDPSARESIEDSLNNALPGLIGHKSGQIDVDQIEAAKTGAGILGLLGLMYAGLGWIDAMRNALRTIWHQNVNVGNFLKTKVSDTVILVGFGLALGVSVMVSSGATTAADTALGWVGMRDSSFARVVIAVLAPTLAILTDIAIFGYLFARLPRVRPPGVRLLQVSLLMAVCFEVLKLGGTYYIDRTTSNPIYGTFAAVVGLLIWINLVCRLTMFCAAWAVTGPFLDDRPPSGTADVESARAAGIPEEFAREGPRLLEDDGAPTPLGPAIRS